jgi:hypothetical protein
MLPVGTTSRYATSASLRRKAAGKGRENQVTKAFQAALKFFAEEGWIDRGREFVRIRDRGALLDDALRGWTEVPDHFIRLDSVAAVIGEALNEPGLSRANAEQRRRELLAIQDLMRTDPQGARWSGRHSVQFVNKGRAL